MTSSATATVTAPAEPSITVDDLARMSIAELTARYRAGRVPESLAVLDGAPAGRMLTVAGALGRGALAATVRRFAASSQFPWGGKSFSSGSAGTGRGINRLRLFGGGREVFPFDTRIEPSVIDGAPCILLDYDKPENPWAIRRIRDELREVSPGVFLGPAMFEIRGTPRLILYFAIDAA